MKLSQSMHAIQTSLLFRSIFVSSNPKWGFFYFILQSAILKAHAN